MVLLISDLKYCRKDLEIERLSLTDGDLLFNRTNSPELVGKSAVFHEGSPMSFASYLIRVRFDQAVVLPDFVNYWLNSAWGRAWAQLAKTDGVSQSNINGSKLALLPLPLPPLKEQEVIVERASQMLELGDSLLVRADGTEAVLRRGSRSVLAKALRGEPVGAANA
jgi:type I restriction enzyme, S subunit